MFLYCDYYYDTRLVPSRYLIVFWMREDWGLGLGVQGVMGREEGKIASLFFLLPFS